MLATASITTSNVIVVTPNVNGALMGVFCEDVALSCFHMHKTKKAIVRKMSKFESYDGKNL